MKRRSWGALILSWISIFFGLRPTNLSAGVNVLRFGVGLLLALVGSFWAWGVFSIPLPGTGIVVDGSISSSEPAFWVQTLLALAALTCFIIAIFFFVAHHRSQSSKRIVCIEHLSYNTSQIRGILKDLPAPYSGIREEMVLIDGRNKSPKDHLKSLEAKMSEAKDKITHGSGPNNYLPMYGGIAAVPMIVLAGFEWGNQNKIHIRDYDRSSGIWHDNEEPDNGALLQSTQLPKTPQSDAEAGLCLEFSMSMDREDMNAKFPNIPMFSMNFSTGKVGLDQLCSEHKQQRLIKEVVDYMNTLIKCFPHLEVLHLFITAQSSFVFRVGQALHQNHIPSVRIHHYDRSQPLGSRHTWYLQISGSGNYEIR
ncbi:MAG: SAVED domain-containing protein [Pseudomonadota bacterium]